nr:major histocompatibility complex class I-related gene protein-like [Nerophis lumbriciformis]
MVTGFYPDLADLFWRKDGEQIFEDVEHGELLPNHDGTFQMSVELKVEVTAEVEGKYECVFRLSGVKEDLVTKLERRSILSNASPQDNTKILPMTKDSEDSIPDAFEVVPPQNCPFPGNRVTYIGGWVMK